jgi:hypothetical protein
MGKLIATTQATVDGVIDPVGEWVQPDGATCSCTGAASSRTPSPRGD